MHFGREISLICHEEKVCPAKIATGANYNTRKHFVTAYAPEALAL